MSPFKQLLASGKTVLMVNPGFPSPGMVEFMGELGFDAVMLDCEHGAAGIERIDEMARAARAARIGAIVRPEYMHEAILTRYLDRGVDGLMIPHVHDRAAAEEIVRIVRYARPRSHQDTVIVAMMESVDALSNLADILKVDGIDAFFIARGDLSKTMGHAGDKRHPEVVAAVDRMIAEIRAAGRVVAGAGDWDQVEGLVAKGMRLIYLNARMLLTQAARDYRALAGTAH